MNWLYYATQFGFGTVKYLFSQWGALAYISTAGDIELSFFNIFVPTYLGAVISMSIFYFSSDFLMERAQKKRELRLKLALENGVVLKQKKIFTKMNKLMVKTKQRFGIYMLTIIAPLFFSIPLGSIICAKFYGDQKQTFPLMMLFTGLYGALTTLLILLING
jgi:hypothetical protein